MGHLLYEWLQEIAAKVLIENNENQRKAAVCYRDIGILWTGKGKHFWRQLGWESPGQDCLILVLSAAAEIGFCSGLQLDFISLCLGFCSLCSEGCAKISGSSLCRVYGIHRTFQRFMELLSGIRSAQQHTGQNPKAMAWAEICDSTDTPTGPAGTGSPCPDGCGANPWSQRESPDGRDVPAVLSTPLLAPLGWSWHPVQVQGSALGCSDTPGLSWHPCPGAGLCSGHPGTPGPSWHPWAVLTPLSWCRALPWAVLAPLCCPGTPVPMQGFALGSARDLGCWR